MKKEEKLYFVIVEEKYSNYLKKYEDKIRDKKNRPYIAIVLEIEGKYYVAPLSSAKEKYYKMKESVDIIKIEQGKLGVVNLNNMIPIYLNENYYKKLNLKKLKKEEKSYYLLLKNQLKYCNNNKKIILEKAKKVYNMRKKEKLTKREKFILKRIVDFQLLENLCSDFEKV